MLSKKTRYALMALTKLSREYGKGAILISDIATAEKIPQRFLENILLELKNLGLLGSKLGKNGGYFLLKNPEDISLADVIRYFEGTIALVYCVSEKAYQPCEFCKNEDSCKLKTVFKTIRDNTFNILQETSIADISKP
jgi:Rrf2 family protein